VLHAARAGQQRPVRQSVQVRADAHAHAVFSSLIIIEAFKGI
jgi:hypothetical protein